MSKCLYMEIYTKQRKTIVEHLNKEILYNQNKGTMVNRLITTQAKNTRPMTLGD